ncbi:MAG TPA: L,D-transpeptidase family protein [Acidimicrobiales bacterium]|nr:L,D-transpeptidase family protein [Acidimicrobiales bacterium]
MHLRAPRTSGHPPTRSGAVSFVALLAAGCAACALAACGATKVGATGATSDHLADQRAIAPPPTAPPPALTLVAATPASGAALAAPTSPITLTLSAPLAADAPDPTLSPAVPGQWTRAGATLTFTPSGEYPPYVSLAVTLPAGERGTGGALAYAAVKLTYTTPTPTARRVQQLLAELDYLPVAFTPAGAAAPLVAAAPTTPASTPPAVSVADQAGAFSWRFPGTPATLAASWHEGSVNVVSQGAIMAFEADHHLTIDGLAGPSVWGALVAAVQAGQVDPRPYDYISVSQARPETLTVWQNGANVYSSPANTGVPGATTEPGTFPVYERFTVTTMSGRNPDGTTYHDPGIPWVAYFNGGDAIHGFVRPGYGYPQSDGCVELPPANAQTVYPMDFYGTLVTVQ